MELLAFTLLLSVGSAARSGFPVTETDAMGVSVTLDRAPRRIVSLAPSTTECAFAVGLGDRIVGVTRFCDYPTEARAKPKVGGYRDVSVEKIVALEPDLLLATRGNPRDAIGQLRRLGVRVFTFETQRLDDVLRCLTVLGRLSGETRGAAQAAERLRQDIAQVRERLGDLAPEDRPGVFFGGYAPPFFSPGRDTYLNDLIELAGGQNIAADSIVRWPQLSLEKIVAANPDVIVCGFSHRDKTPQDAKTALERFRSRKAWRRVAAVQNARVYVVEHDPFMRPTPRLGHALRVLAACLHPDKFNTDRGQREP